MDKKIQNYLKQEKKQETELAGKDYGEIVLQKFRWGATRVSDIYLGNI